MKRPAELLARYGGEELVVLLPDTPAAGASAMAGEIQRAIAELHLRHEASPVGPELTVSIGVATALPSAAVMATTLLAAADAALYAAKAAGRNCIVVQA
ncbi:MAG: diguanylate cyclase [Rubrivivax sp.]|nr:diguanylate cyclase [Rubrivivax sp.]